MIKFFYSFLETRQSVIKIINDKRTGERHSSLEFIQWNYDLASWGLALASWAQLGSLSSTNLNCEKPSVSTWEPVTPAEH